MNRKTLLLTGILGLLGALLVGIGEFLMQFNPQGGYEIANYPYFARISQANLTIGHFLGALSIPLYFFGYIHLGHTLDTTPKRLIGKWITYLGIYSFAIGGIWLGGRIYLALVVKEIAAGQPLEALLEAMAAHNEPLVNVLRVAILIISILWITQIARGRSLYPKWVAAISPILILSSIFLLYSKAPAIGTYLLPAAMNVTHILIFGLSCILIAKRPVDSKTQ